MPGSTTPNILDPACGSGNFLYLALKRLLDLWHEARVFGIQHGLTIAVEPIPHPGQLFGIETDFYAHEIASIVVWIGFLQWKRDHGVIDERSPVLQKLTNIEHDDAIMRYDEGKPYEPQWHATDFIIGNPPFLGGQDMQGDLGGKYVSDLRNLYLNRVPGSSDLVLFWFEKARAMIETSSAQRAGLIGTQAIRGGENRKVLEAIKSSGDIFWAISDRKWPQPNSKERNKGEKREKKVMVHISMVAFDGGLEKTHELDGQIVSEIHANLKSGLDTTTAHRLRENRGLSFQWPVKVGKFEIGSKMAEFLLASPNPHLVSNSLVIKPWMNGNDIKLRPQHRSIIDFGGLSEIEAALFERPFDHIKKKVFLERQKNKDQRRKQRWWLHGASGSTLKKAVEHLDRFVVTTRHSKHRIFSWAPKGLLPDSALVVIARQDDFFFGVLQSKLHEIWARQQGTQLREAESGFRYTPKSTFDTFPFPYPPYNEPRHIPAELARMEAIASAARKLVELRDAWLNPPDIPDAELKKRTLTNLYNQRPTWLANAHRILDEAVFAAYGWPATLSKEEILARLLALNHERAAAQSKPTPPVN